MRTEREPRKLVIHPSLIRPVFWGGADRRLAMPLWTVVLLLLFATPIHPLTIGIAVVLGVGGQIALVRAAKADPYWFDIYLRTLHYQPYYPPHSSVRAKPGRVTSSFPW